MTALAPPTSPDWDTIAHDVLCPLCDYNLRGLPDPRCPECGARFDWAEVTDPEKRLHPYLVEHHNEVFRVAPPPRGGYMNRELSQWLPPPSSPTRRR